MNDVISVYDESTGQLRDINEALRLFFSADGFSFVKDEDTADIVIRANSIRVFEKLTYTEDIKKTLITVLSEYTGYKPRFGLMTGIRPTHPGFVKMKQGCRVQDIKDMYINRYMVNEHAADMLTETVKTEYDILSGYDENKFAAMYISVPFCAGVCSYCTFSAGYADDETKERYISVLTEKILRASECAKQAKREIRCVYIGGGTPGELDIRQLDRLLEVIAKVCVDAIEFTFEAGRPDSLNRQKLKLLKDADVTRICINTQTVNDRTLLKIGRNHTYDDFLRMYHNIREAGSWCVNSDIIIGFENETHDDMLLSIRKIIELDPQNISVHPLAIKKKRQIKIRNHDKNDELIWYNIVQLLRYGGYLPYYLYRQKSCWNNQESAGFAKRGFECLYNIAMNEGFGMITGCGYRASSVFDNRRVPPSKNSFGIKKIF